MFMRGSLEGYMYYPLPVNAYGNSSGTYKSPEDIQKDKDNQARFEELSTQEKIEEKERHITLGQKTMAVGSKMILASLGIVAATAAAKILGIDKGSSLYLINMGVGLVGTVLGSITAYDAWESKKNHTEHLNNLVIEQDVDKQIQTKSLILGEASTMTPPAPTPELSREDMIKNAKKNVNYDEIGPLTKKDYDALTPAQQEAHAHSIMESAQAENKFGKIGLGISLGLTAACLGSYALGTPLSLPESFGIVSFLSAAAIPVVAAMGTTLSSISILTTVPKIEEATQKLIKLDKEKTGLSLTDKIKSSRENSGFYTEPEQKNQFTM